VLYKFSLYLLLPLSLSGCVTEGQADTSRANAVGALTTQSRTIDWDRAERDATLVGNQGRLKRARDGYVVPLLLPPQRVSTSGALAQVSFSEPQTFGHAQGYSAVIKSAVFDMLIDASQQMIRTEDAGTQVFPQDFDGEYSLRDNSSQLTIGSYGALYAIQFICTGGFGNCVPEQSAREIVQALQVKMP